MKHLKLYEELNRRIDIDDYVLVHDIYHNFCSDYSDICKEIYNFISNNPGKIRRIINLKSEHREYMIDYDNVPENIKSAFKERYVNKKYNQLYMTYTKQEIIFSSKNKNDVEIFLQTKKYNL